ncbi:MAG: DUF4981 domain-containing protein [Bacteroidales bacterium]|nr:DUF4981 domain-containing protein [Bacteroidales bacterium]
MKRALAVLLTAAATATLYAQTPWWQDTQTTSIGAETQRTEIIFHPTKEDALGKGFRASVNYQDLNGTWDFKYFDDYRNIPAESFSDGEAMERFTSKLSWDSIRVPGNWEVQGFGVPIYTNHAYDFCPRNPEPPQLPEAFPAGIYHKKFTLPEAWKDRQVYLNLCGTKSGTYVYVNGALAGYHEDSKDLARYNISGLVRDGENELTLMMMRYSTGSYLECQDFWRISGIERDVYLSSEKTDTGFDFSVISTLDENLEKGLFKLRMKSDAPTEVYYELIDKDGSVLSDAVFEFNGRMATTIDTIPSPRKWSAETPELYTLLLRVNGEFARFHVGFRRFEIKEVPGSDGRPVKVYMVNGQPVKFKGVNLHEHNPLTGHYVDKAMMLKDLTLMKEANINAVRTSHYPQPREFYELCDSVGIYVWDEANIESHGMYYGERSLAKKAEWQKKHIDRTLNMYRRTSNYPCVTMLSLGNEAGNGVNFHETYRILKALEKNGMNRAVTYERAEDEWNSDFRCPMYVSAGWFRNQGEKYSRRPVVPVEYAHAMGNSTGAFDLMWDEINSYVNTQGGFIWDWVDQGLKDERGWTYGGDYGENAPSDGNFNLNGIVDPDRRPHPGYFAVKKAHQDIAVSPVEPLKGCFSVFNRFYFKSLENYILRYRVERDGKIVKKGKAALSAAPQSSEQVKVRIPWMFKKGEYRIIFETVTARALPLLAKGSVVAEDDFLLKDSSRKKVYKDKGVVSMSENDSTIVLSSKKATLVYDKTEGVIVSYKVRGRDVVEEGFGIRPVFHRAPTDNDYGNGEPARTLAWKRASASHPARAEVRSTGDRGVLAVTLTLPAGASMESVYTLYPSGVLHIENQFRGSSGKSRYDNYFNRRGNVTEIPRLGFRMRLPGEKFSYFGRGPVENYWDRKGGSVRSLWHSNASAELFPYARPQETGHHTEVSWLEVGKLSAVSDSLFEFSVLHQRIEDLDGEECAARDYQWNNFDTPVVHDTLSAVNRMRRQTHISDVPAREDVELVIDYKMTGVGGYDSWGWMPEPSQSLWANGNYSWGFTLIPKNALSSRKSTRFIF